MTDSATTNVWNRIGAFIPIADASSRLQHNCVSSRLASSSIWNWYAWLRDVLDPIIGAVPKLEHVFLHNPGGWRDGKMQFSQMGEPHMEEFRDAWNDYQAARIGNGLEPLKVHLYLGSPILDQRITEPRDAVDYYTAIGDTLRNCDITGMESIIVDHVGQMCVGDKHQDIAALVEQIDELMSEYLYIEPRPLDLQWARWPVCDCWPRFDRADPDKYADANHKGNLTNDKSGPLMLLITQFDTREPGKTQSIVDRTREALAHPKRPLVMTQIPYLVKYGLLANNSRGWTGEDFEVAFGSLDSRSPDKAQADAARRADGGVA